MCLVERLTKSMDTKKEIQTLESDIQSIYERANFIVIEKEDAQQVSDTIKELRKKKKAIEDRRDEITKPLFKAYKSSRDLFSPVIDKIDEVSRKLNSALSQYEREQLLKKQEEERKIKQKQVGAQRKLREAENKRKAQIDEKNSTREVAKQQNVIAELEEERKEVKEARATKSDTSRVHTSTCLLYTSPSPRDS